MVVDTGQLGSCNPISGFFDAVEKALKAVPSDPGSFYSRGPPPKICYHGSAYID